MVLPVAVAMGVAEVTRGLFTGRMRTERLGADTIGNEVDELEDKFVVILM